MANHNPFKVSALAAAIAAAGVATPVYALFDYEEGDFKVQMDANVSIGAGWRADDLDYRYVGNANATAAFLDGRNPNNYRQPDTSSIDNADQNWKKGSTYSEVVRAVVDVEMNYKNYGAFVRGRTFYDHRIIHGDGVTDRATFYPNPDNGNSYEPVQSTGTGGEILDAFVWGDWWVADRPLNVRLGKQVISWGEGLFFANGINTINPVDVNALLAPGSELKEALIPVESLFGSFGITDNLSVEAFYQFKWRETQAPDCGTFFSTSDLVGPGCYAGFYAGGLEAGAPSSQYVRLPRGNDIEGSDDDQYGLALRYLIEPIGTEVAFYHIRYNSRLPVVSGTAGDFSNTTDRATIQTVAYLQRDAAIDAALGPLAALYDSSAWAPNLVGTDGSNLAVRDALIGTASLLPGITSLTTFLATNPLSPYFGNAAAAQAVATQFARGFGGQQGALLLPYGEYNVDYPDDIRLWGFSFNTNIDFGLPGGETAVSGEISYRENQPMQIEDSVTLTAAIGLPSQYCADAGFDCYQVYEAGDYMPGYIREEFWQAEFAFIHFFERVLGADRWTAILNMAYNYATIPDKDVLLMNSTYNADPTNPYSPGSLYTPVFSVEGAGSYYPTNNSWGYRMRFAGDYSNVFAGINLRPSISFNHDVQGVTPGPMSNFLEDRKSVGLALEADYLNTYVMKVGYTDFFGAEPFNQLADRDFYSLSLSASF